MTAPVRALAKRAPRTPGYLAASLLVFFAAASVAIACVGPAEPTTLTTSLSGESKSGAEITVLEGTKVKDQATLEGKNAAKATGKISYAVYKDSSCKELVTKAGEFEFKEGKVPASEEEKLEGGNTYYWQAHYGGDSLDAESTSSCGGEVLTVEPLKYRSTEYPVILKGMNFTLKEVFKFNGNPFECKIGQYTGTLAGPAVSLKLKPGYAECEGFGQLLPGLGSFERNECEYELTKPEQAGAIYAAKVNIVCPAGHKILVKASIGLNWCETEIGAQSGIAKFELENRLGPPRWIEVRPRLSNFAYHVTRVQEPECGLSTGENRNDGTYEGEIELRAVEGALFIG